MRHYNKVPKGQGLIKVNNTKEEDSLKIQLEKVKTMGDQGFVTKGLMYSDRKDGVLPEFDIRTDKWQIAEDAALKASRAEIKLRSGEKGAVEKPELSKEMTEGETAA